MSRLHQKVPANELGRDFIVGDLHGCLDLLEIELARVQFDPAVDRLFSVGDLIDRGPDSMGCLRLLLQPWFYAVRGNHETMLLEYFHALDQPYSALRATKTFFQNGGRWVTNLSDRDQDELPFTRLDTQIQLQPPINAVNTLVVPLVIPPKKRCSQR